MSFQDPSLRTIAEIEAYMNPSKGILESSAVSSVADYFSSKSEAQRILGDINGTRDLLMESGYARHLQTDSLVASAVSGVTEAARIAASYAGYAMELTATKHALGISSASELAQQYRDSLQIQPSYINELEKFHKSLIGDTGVSEIAKLRAGLSTSTAMDYARDMLAERAVAGEASAKAFLDQVSGRMTIALEAQRPHVLMDAFQRGTAWLNPFEEVQKTSAAWEAERYLALNAATDPMRLFQDTLNATFRNPFIDIAGENTRRIFESLQSLGIATPTSIDEIEDVEVTDEDLVSYVSLARTHLGNQVSIDAASIEELVVAFVAAYENLPSVRAKKIFQTYVYPFLLALFFSYINPYNDFIVKQKLEAANSATAKTVQQVARNSGVPRYVQDSFRFVNTKVLTVRVNGKIRSPAIGTLHFGQPVEILRKEDDWTLVHYSDSDSEIEIQGWVLSRYLKKYW